jgi:hypothetical protein
MDGEHLANSIAMTAVLKTANGSSTIAGQKTYKLAFIYPRGFLTSLDEFLGMTVEVYWNDAMVSHAAHVNRMHQHPQPDSDPVYIIDMDADPSDTALANLANEIQDSGELRLVANQLALLGRN